MLDLKQYDTRDAANQGVTFWPTLPGETEPTDQFSLTVLGVDSDDFRAIQIAEARDSLGKGKRKSTGEEYSDQEIIDMVEGRAEVVAALVKDWQGVALNGEELECSRDNVLMVLNQFPWLKRQINVFAGTVANFLPNAANRGSGE